MLVLHVEAPLDHLARAWSREPGIVVPLAIVGGLYGLGLTRLWRFGIGRGVSRTQAAAFATGWLVLVAALVSPIHALSEQLFSVHMVQHELLMTLAAPLLVIGRPVVPLVWALPPSGRRLLPRALRTGPLKSAWGAITRPFNAWLLHAAAIWLWHMPAPFQATLTSDAVHALQHLSFLGTALLFWWSLLAASPSTRGAGVLYLFTTAVHTGVLGALMTFSRTLWYPAYASGAAAWGMTPLEDQQLAGLIMWIPGSVAYLIGALTIAAAWLRESEWRVAQRERASLARSG